MGASVSRIVEEARLKNGLQELNLNSVGIKTLPQNLEDFRSLYQVNLANNGIKELPITLESFVNLEVVNIHNNNIKRLSEFGVRSSLRILIASVNKIKTLPMSLGACVNLYSIDLSSNKFKEFPTVLCVITSLRIIHLADNKIKYIPSEIGQLKNLETLDVGNNKIEFLPAQIGGLSKLHELFIEDNRLHVLPIELGNVPLVENNLSLRMYHNPLKRRIKRKHRKGNRVLWSYLHTDKYRLFLAGYMDRWERKSAKKMAKKERKHEKERIRKEKRRQKWAEKTRRKMEKEGHAVAFVAAPSSSSTRAPYTMHDTTTGIPAPTYTSGDRGSRKLSPEEASLVVGVAPEIARTAPPSTIRQPVRTGNAPQMQSGTGATFTKPTENMATSTGMPASATRSDDRGIKQVSPSDDTIPTGYRGQADERRIYQQNVHPQQEQQKDIQYQQQPASQVPASDKTSSTMVSGKQGTDSTGGVMEQVAASVTQTNVPTHEYYGRSA